MRFSPRSNRSSWTHLHLSDTRLLPEGGREGEGSPANVEKRSHRAEREGVEVTLDTEVAFWYAPNPAMHSIQPESLSVSPFHGPVGANRTPEEPQFYYMPVCLFPGAFSNNKYLEFNVNLLVCVVLGRFLQYRSASLHQIYVSCADWTLCHYPDPKRIPPGGVVNSTKHSTP